jgi:hypothetical protein
MELEGVVHNGVIVPDDATVLPEGTRVRITPAPPDGPKPFGKRYARFKGAAVLPADDGDAEEGAAYVNEVMAEDDANDPYLESYQHYGKTT